MTATAADGGLHEAVRARCARRRRSAQRCAAITRARWRAGESRALHARPRAAAATVAERVAALTRRALSRRCRSRSTAAGAISRPAASTARPSSTPARRAQRRPRWRARASTSPWSACCSMPAPAPLALSPSARAAQTFARSEGPGGGELSRLHGRALLVGRRRSAARRRRRRWRALDAGALAAGVPGQRATTRWSGSTAAPALLRRLGAALRCAAAGVQRARPARRICSTH